MGNLVLEKLTIDRYIGRLHIKEDGSINASNVWKEELGDQDKDKTDPDQRIGDRNAAKQHPDKRSEHRHDGEFIQGQELTYKREHDVVLSCAAR